MVITEKFSEIVKAAEFFEEKGNSLDLVYGQLMALAATSVG